MKSTQYPRRKNGTVDIEKLREALKYGDVPEDPFNTYTELQDEREKGGTRYCKRCTQRKPLTEFFMAPKKQDFRYVCKDCCTWSERQRWSAEEARAAEYTRSLMAKLDSPPLLVPRDV